jgi:hypothetical protein
MFLGMIIPTLGLPHGLPIEIDMVHEMGIKPWNPMTELQG